MKKSNMSEINVTIKILIIVSLNTRSQSIEESNMTVIIVTIKLLINVL